MPSERDSHNSMLSMREFDSYIAAQAELASRRERETDLRFKSLSDHIDLRFDSMDKALKLAAIETGKHLESLNGEQARLLADRERFLSRDTYDVAQKQFGIWRDQVNASIALGTGREKGIGLSWGVIMAVISIGIAIAAMVVKLK